MEGIYIEKQTLTYDGWCLGEENTLSDYKIQNGSILHLVSKAEATTMTQNKAVDYVSRLRKILSEGEMEQFKAGMTGYKKTKRFEVLVPVLKIFILANHSKDKNLARDFRVFVSGKHFSDFELFCNSTAASL